jgi:hypothetical protein
VNSGPHPPPLPTATAVGSPWGMRVRTALQAPTWRQRPRRTRPVPRWPAGDPRRAAGRASGGELGELGTAFNAMAEALAFRSEPGAGTIFSVRIPVRPPGAEPAEDATTV